MKPQQITRDNHYVPQLYLKQWSSDGTRIWTYRLLVEHPKVSVWHPYSLKSIAYYENLYTRLMASGETDAVERWFHHDFEQPVERVIERIMADRFLTPNEWRTLTRFTVAQYVRTPAHFVAQYRRWIETFPGVMQQALHNGVQRLTAAHERGEPLPTRHAPEPPQLHFPFPIKLTPELAPGAAMATLKGETLVGRGTWFWYMQHVLTTTIANIGDLQWTILRPPKGVTWLTSDDPVICLRYADDQYYDFQGGWGAPGTEIIMPLGPQHLLYAKVGTSPLLPRGTVVSQKQADTFQRMIAAHAYRLIFAVDKDLVVADLRPRIVDKDRMHAEREQWQQWHQEQSAAEQRFFDPARDTRVDDMRDDIGE